MKADGGAKAQDDAGGGQPEGCLQKFSHAIETRMSGFFSKLGRGVGINPGRTLILALIGCLIGMSGFSVIENESRGDKLWLPTGTRAQDDWVSSFCFSFGVFVFSLPPPPVPLPVYQSNFAGELT